MLKRLIEVALPLKEVSGQSAREKSIRHGHISTLHLCVGAEAARDEDCIRTWKQLAEE